VGGLWGTSVGLSTDAQDIARDVENTAGRWSSMYSRRQCRFLGGGSRFLTSTQFSAAGSVLGYLYQCRIALLWTLRRARSQGQAEFTVVIEGLDDVSFESDASVTELLQTKHHVSRRGNLTDTSEDLWKTLRVWCDGWARGIVPHDSAFYLITTAVAPAGSAAHYLRPSEERCPEAALERLRAVARLRGNRSNSSAYDTLLCLADPDQSSLIGSVVVLDSVPAIDRLDDLIDSELTWAVEAGKRASLRQRLEAWWMGRVVAHLVAKEQAPILSAEVTAQIDDLREQFKRDNLPIDDDLLDAEIDFRDYQDRTFVRQLGLIDVVGRGVVFAIKDYYRAYEQRSRWVREDLLLVGDLSRYEARLVDEWDRRFEVMCRQLGADAAEDAKRRAAQAVYQWVELDANITIRPQCTESFVTRGSFQMLADELKVGWHPDFADRLRRLLDEAVTS